MPHLKRRNPYYLLSRTWWNQPYFQKVRRISWKFSDAPVRLCQPLSPGRVPSGKSEQTTTYRRGKGGEIVYLLIAAKQTRYHFLVLMAINGVGPEKLFNGWDLLNWLPKDLWIMGILLETEKEASYLRRVDLLKVTKDSGFPVKLPLIRTVVGAILTSTIG